MPELAGNQPAAVIGNVRRRARFIGNSSPLIRTIRGAQRKLAFVLQSSGALEGAAACYRRAIALDPADARADDELGRLIGLGGDMAAARTCSTP